MAVKKSFDMKAWTEWPDEEIKLREPEAIKNTKESSRMKLTSGVSYSTSSMNSGKHSESM